MLPCLIRRLLDQPGEFPDTGTMRILANAIIHNLNEFDSSSVGQSWTLKPDQEGKEILLYIQAAFQTLAIPFLSFMSQ